VQRAEHLANDFTEKVDSFEKHFQFSFKSWKKKNSDIAVRYDSMIVWVKTLQEINNTLKGEFLAGKEKST